MNGATGRLMLPMLEPGQAQKEVTHNEALARLDLAVQSSVTAAGVDTPPVGPSIGQSWIVGATPSGAWAGHAGALAGWTAGGWRFVAPFAGLSAWSVADGSLARFDGAAWRVGDLTGARVVIAGNAVVGPRGAAIADPSAGSVVDGKARTAIVAILTAMRAHGLIAAG